MQFLVIAYDGKDNEAPARRVAARSSHLEGVEAFKAQGKHLYGAAILDDAGNMIGSMMVVEFDSRQALEREWLGSEPYVTQGVWRQIDIQPCRVPPVFGAAVR